MKKAWIENNSVRDVCPGDPSELYHPDIAVHYTTDVPDGVVNGATWNGSEWINPPSPEPELPAELIPPISPIAFQMLFTVDELIAIDAAKSTNAAIRIFWKLLDDPRTEYVDRNLESVKTMLYSLEQAGLIGEGRANEILTSGAPK